MASEALQKFADELRAAREAKGISILQISTRTKIDPKFLTAIENADFDILPELYVRAFIKEFALTIDLNPKEVIQKFDSAKSGFTEKPQVVVKEQSFQPILPKEQVEIQNKRSEVNSAAEQSVSQQSKEFGTTHDLQSVSTNEAPKSFVQTNLNIVVGVLVLIVAAIVFYFALFYESSPEIITDQQEQSLSSNAERFEVKKEDQPVVTPDSLPLVTQLKTDDLRLKVQNTGQVWIKVLSDGKIVQQGVVKKDSILNFTAKKQFGISVGNAGAVKLFFNDKPVKNVGRVGEIRNITITPDTIRYLTIQRNEKKPSNPNR